MKIAVDAMGGDYAPGVVIEGLTQALYDFPDCEFLLVGHRDKLGFYLQKYGIAGHDRLEIVHAESVVEMSDPSAISLRAKKDSSITECARLMKAGRVEAIVSPGHTGALVAATKVLNRTLPGVDRPGLAAALPWRNGRFLLVDAGANPDCHPANLIQFALMGEIYAKFLFHSEKPTIGLLSVGGEDGKGSGLTKTVFKMLSSMPVNFIGNVESDTAFEGGCDVLVSDGFSGNVMLKTSEGLARMCGAWLKNAIRKNAVRAAGGLLARNAFTEVKALGAAETIGGAPLLGINGICIVGHGSSNPRSVRNAIRTARNAIKFDMNEKIRQRLAECHATTAELEAAFQASAEQKEQ